jgi:signal transduction histidine kinase
MKPVIETSFILSRYQQLIEISRELASTLDLDVLLKRIIQAAVDLSESQAASILLYDESTHQLYFQTATNMEDPLLRGMSVPLEGSICGWAVANRKSVVVADAHHDPRFFDNVEKTTRILTNSLIAVPMITQEKVLGVLEVLNKKEGEYTPEDIDTLEVLAAQAAVAIQNTRLFQQSDLISELVHEIRTPLASLVTASYLLQRSEISEKQRSELATTIYSEAQRLNELASSFLDLARLESGRAGFQMALVDLPKLLDECRKVVQAKTDESGIQLAVEIQDGLPGVEGDAGKLKQVILNLLSNSIKYNRPGGTITLSAMSDKNEVQIKVSDTGIGIPADALPHLFEKFYRVSGSEKVASGTGLGLSICKHIVESHHGRIEAFSNIGQGSTFIVHLPVK